jgi:hypothetical protein
MDVGPQRGGTARVAQGLQTRQHDLTIEQMILVYPAVNLPFVGIQLGAPLGTGNRFRLASQVAPYCVASDAQFSGDGMNRLSLCC